MPGPQTLLSRKTCANGTGDDDQKKRISGSDLIADAQQQPQLDERYADQQEQKLEQHCQVNLR